jgi:hypothetical protein
MLRSLAAILISAIVASAQTPAEWPPPKMVELKHVSPGRIKDSGVLNPFIQSLNVDPNGRFVVITAMTAQKLAAAEELLRRLDVAPRNVELMFHIVAGGAATQATGNTLPSDLEPVVKQLRSSFPFPAYRLLDTAMVRTRDGSDGSIDGSLPTGARYSIAFQPIRVTEESPRQVRINNLRLRHYFVTGRTEKGNITEDAYVTADIDVKEGQKAVVGKSTMRDTALFLVVSARVVD